MPIASMASLKNKGDIGLSQVPVRHNSSSRVFSPRVCDATTDRRAEADPLRVPVPSIAQVVSKRDLSMRSRGKQRLRVSLAAVADSDNDGDAPEPDARGGFLGMAGFASPLEPGRAVASSAAVAGAPESPSPIRAAASTRLPARRGPPPPRRTRRGATPW